MTRTLRRFPVLEGKEALLRSKLRELLGRGAEVVSALRYEGCRLHRIYLEQEEEGVFLIVEREDERPVQPSFAEREAATGNSIYRVLNTIVIQCLDAAAVEELDSETVLDLVPFTDFVLRK